MRILVTGSSGLVGRSAVAQLEESGHEVVPFDVDGGADLRSRQGQPRREAAEQPSEFREWVWIDHAEPELYDIGAWWQGHDVPRTVDVALHLERVWSTSQYTLCEGHYPNPASPQGDSDATCSSWNTATASIGLDRLPSETLPFAAVTFDAELHTPTEGDGGLPPGYGDPRYFGISADVVLSVTYN